MKKMSVTILLLLCFSMLVFGEDKKNTEVNISTASVVFDYYPAIYFSKGKATFETKEKSIPAFDLIATSTTKNVIVHDLTMTEYKEIIRLLVLNASNTYFVKETME